jgi:hypothetical protein
VLGSQVGARRCWALGEGGEGRYADRAGPARDHAPSTGAAKTARVHSNRVAPSIGRAMFGCDHGYLPWFDSL